LNKSIGQVRAITREWYKKDLHDPIVMSLIAKNCEKVVNADASDLLALLITGTIKFSCNATHAAGLILFSHCWKIHR
jgi:hypothetical protein